MNYLSVCSGIEAATVAWHHLGWKPVGFSEIEKFPSQVLAHHYPHVTNYGDMTKFKEWNINEPVNLLVGGTPCQSFSVAGLRKGLEDPRGNLMLTYLAMANHFKPKWLLWENVPGVLSSNGGHDFATLLQGMAQCGYGFAYRILDAQYFGVPQRRRRVFVVGCLGDWRSAAKVLFESESLCGDITPRRGEGKEVAPTITRGFGDRGYDLDQIAGGGYKVDFPQDTVGALDTECGFQKASHQSINQGHILALNKDEEPLNPHVNGTITTRTGRSQNNHEEVVVHPFREADLHNYKETDVAGTLKASGGVLAGGSETFAVINKPIFYESHGQDSRYNEVNVCPTISASFGMGGGHIPLTHNVPLAIAENIIGRQPENGGNGEGWAKDTMYTLNATGVHGVAYGVGEQPHIAHCLRSGASKADKHESTTYIVPNMRVRRLTPKECERLQGFPDDYTNIPNAPDTGRYKALGNSMAVPVMKWIGERINDA